MYTIRFCGKNQNDLIFHNVERIEVGSIGALQTIPEDEVLTKTYKPTGFYHLTGASLNAVYCSEDCICIDIRKEIPKTQRIH